MNYGQLQHFFEMGGYGVYVWSAYAITFAVLLMNFISPRFRHRQLLRRKLSSFSSQIKLSKTHVADS
jgi:heme exporter protein D